ncbi:MAG: AAA family ATPase [Nannocystaceae bacterium]
MSASRDKNSPAPFASAEEHLLAALRCLDVLLYREAIRARRAASGDPGQRGLFVTDDELLALLERSPAEPLWSPIEVGDDLAALSRAWSAGRLQLRAREEATAEAGTRLRLCEVGARFDLSERERDVLILAIAAEIDLRYERIFGWLHDDIGRRRPSVQIALDLLAPGLEGRLAALQEIAGDGPLSRLLDLGAPADAPRLRRELRAAPGLLRWLAGGDALDPALASGVRRVDPGPDRDAGLALDPALATRLEALRAELSAPDARALVHLVGPAGAGRRSFAAALCGALGRPLYVVDGTWSMGQDEAGFDQLLAGLWRAARLEGAAILWTEAELLDEAAARLRRRRLSAGVAERGPSLFFFSREAPAPVEVGDAAVHDEVILPIPDRAQRIALWARYCPDAAPADREAAADAFRFAPGRIEAAARDALALARARGSATPNAADLLRAGRRRATPRLGALATRVDSPYHWRDLVVPREREEQLHDLVARLRRGPQVLDEWGFGRAMASSRGVSALFHGPPGTGKTMAAAIVAREAGQDLYRIDLSQVVSKYIGETEKHLERVFSEAESTDVALFFDEADALFGKRGKIRDAHDRYANIEVGYLLQRVESFAGMVILATNLRGNMDDAFVRRLQLIVEFPPPDVESRARIWAQVWPKEAPVDPSLDPAVLAERFELSGGHIRNIALAAAYSAAERGGRIGYREILAAARQEYRKLDKLVDASRFAVP